ncbi:MAG: HIT domain-containing protein [Burkholderia sp.]
MAKTDYLGFCRVIWQAHVVEFSDLGSADHSHLSWRRGSSAPRASSDAAKQDQSRHTSLCNQVPHVHLHVIPRCSNDAYFPQPICVPRQRSASEPLLRL